MQLQAVERDARVIEHGDLHIGAFSSNHRITIVIGARYRSPFTCRERDRE